MNMNRNKKYTVARQIPYYQNMVSLQLVIFSKQTFHNYSPVKAFWIKLKTIIKVSIERISTLRIPQMQKIYDFYHNALNLITKHTQSGKSINAYKQIEHILKKRNIEASLLGRQLNSPTVHSYSQQKMQKNRSQRIFKQKHLIGFTLQNQHDRLGQMETLSLASQNHQNKWNNRYLQLDNIQEDDNENVETNKGNKIKSLNRIKNRKNQHLIRSNVMNLIKIQQYGKLKSSSKASQKYVKKIVKQTQKYERNFEGVLDGRYDITCLDKKKTIFQNIYTLYDDLFAKNIPNHKMISKFMFNTTKMNKMLYNAYEKKKKIIKKQKEKEKEKEKQKQKDNKDNKDKEKLGFVINSNDKKQKQKQKQKIKKQSHNQDKYAIKSVKNHRKLLTVKQKTQQLSLGESIYNKQYCNFYKDKKQSQITTINSTNIKPNNNHLISINLNQNNNIYSEKSVGEKQKKVIRSKTAKIKINQDITQDARMTQINTNKHSNIFVKDKDKNYKNVSNI